MKRNAGTALVCALLVGAFGWAGCAPGTPGPGPGTGNGAGKKDAGPPPDTRTPSPDTRTPPTSTAPKAGSWKYGEFGKSENTCKRDEVLTNGDGGFLLTSKGNGGFLITPPDGTEPFNCTLTGSTFSCPERAAANYDTGLAATLKVRVKASGSFRNDENMSGVQEGRATCEGANCTAAAAALGTTFPCTFKVNFNAKAQ